MTNSDNIDKVKECLEANLLDGDKIQPGQMIAATEILEVVTELITTEKKALLQQLRERLPEQQYPKSLDRYGMPKYTEPLILESIMPSLPGAFKGAWNGGHSEALDQITKAIDKLEGEL